MDVDSLMRELERPPTKDNRTVVNIIQLIIMLIIGLDAGKDLFDVFKFGSFSFIDLVKIVVNGLLFCGLCLAGYGYFKDERGPSKNGYMLFIFGLIGELITISFDNNCNFTLLLIISFGISFNATIFSLSSLLHFPLYTVPNAPLPNIFE